MHTTDDTRFSEKHDPAERPDSKIEAALIERNCRDEVPCAVAFDVAEALGRSPADVGKTIDLMNSRLVKCQLGLFGYAPRKKIVSAKPPASPELEAAIRDAMAGDRLPCHAAWAVAAQMNVRKMTVSAACEALGIRIKPCQLGAF